MAEQLILFQSEEQIITLVSLSHFYSSRFFKLPTALLELLRIQKKIKRGLMTTKNEKVGLPPFDAAPPISGRGAGTTKSIANTAIF